MDGEVSADRLLQWGINQRDEHKQTEKEKKRPKGRTSPPRPRSSLELLETWKLHFAPPPTTCAHKRPLLITTTFILIKIHWKPLAISLSLLIACTLARTYIQRWQSDRRRITSRSRNRIRSKHIRRTSSLVFQTHVHAHAHTQLMRIRPARISGWVASIDRCHPECHPDGVCKMVVRVGVGGRIGS
jgi:hypothetical protein